MCGRFAASADAEELIEFFAIDDALDTVPAPAYNIAPTDAVAAVLERDRDGARRRLLTGLRWGLVPSWSKTPTGAARLINARVETVAEKPSFRKAFATRRCLIPADGYYEWHGRTEFSGRSVKQPYFLHRRDGQPLAMAGLYEFWKSPAGEWLATATIITTQATDALGWIHDRMPMVVAAQDWARWLDPALPGELGLLSDPVSSLDYHRVSPAVNSVANDGPELLIPVVGELE